MISNLGEKVVGMLSSTRDGVESYLDSGICTSYKKFSIIRSILSHLYRVD